MKSKDDEKMTAFGRVLSIVLDGELAPDGGGWGPEAAGQIRFA